VFTYSAGSRRAEGDHMDYGRSERERLRGECCKASLSLQLRFVFGIQLSELMAAPAKACPPVQRQPGLLSYRRSAPSGVRTGSATSFNGRER
jgi:hypothetical protein